MTNPTIITIIVGGLMGIGAALGGYALTRKSVHHFIHANNDQKGSNAQEVDINIRIKQSASKEKHTDNTDDEAGSSTTVSTSTN